MADIAPTPGPIAPQYYIDSGSGKAFTMDNPGQADLQSLNTDIKSRAVRPATPEEVTGIQHRIQLKAENSGGVGAIKTGVEGFATGLSLGTAPAIEAKLGISTPEAIKARAEIWPILHGGTEALGIAGPLLAEHLLAPEVAIPQDVAMLGARGGAEVAGEAGLGSILRGGARVLGAPVRGVAALGRGVEALAGETLGEGAIGRIAAKSFGAALENTAFEAGHQISEASIDPNWSSDALMGHLGTAVLTGGVLGAGFGAAGVGASKLSRALTDAIPAWKDIAQSVESFGQKIIAKANGLEPEEVARMGRFGQKSGEIGGNLAKGLTGNFQKMDELGDTISKNLTPTTIKPTSGPIDFAMEDLPKSQAIKDNFGTIYKSPTEAAKRTDVPVGIVREQLSGKYLAPHGGYSFSSLADEAPKTIPPDPAKLAAQLDLGNAHKEWQTARDAAFADLGGTKGWSSNKINSLLSKPTEETADRLAALQDYAQKTNKLLDATSKYQEYVPGSISTQDAKALLKSHQAMLGESSELAKYNARAPEIKETPTFGSKVSKAITHGIIGHAITAGEAAIPHFGSAVAAYEFTKGALEHLHNPMAATASLAKLAGTGERVLGRVQSAAQNIVNASESTMATHTAAIAARVMSPNETKVSFDKRTKIIQKIDLGNMDHATNVIAGSQLHTHAPSTAAGVVAGSMRMGQYLQANLPHPMPNGALAKPRQVSLQEMTTFNRKWDAVNDPVGTLAKASTGQITQDELAAIGATHPGILDVYRQHVIRSIATKGQDNLTWRTRQNIAKVLGQPVDNSPDIAKAVAAMGPAPTQSDMPIAPVKQHKLESSAPNRFMTPAQQSAQRPIK